ncbi:prepilin-type N-terminal cleavage/methylation domain-containing protein [Patescibacteria group bacterium]|nr:prepilin-type N-terminal cleavage/methylation domain-containing protein [Patescibacteria group bacterium]MBU1673278.1 prepilin-type N-terminal cleavage/methylation domain-containing protein [Patescibacteria group bacterium]MBU1964086.1 prepilin-type N-terminal cleavage/methylation domain-containing protein [Patescibacteria group bacterium]
MKKQGFTIVEIMLVMAIIAILMAIVLIAINPFVRFGESRDTARWEEVGSIGNAVVAYSADNRGALPSGISTDAFMLGTATSGCNVTCGVTSGVTSTSKSFVDDDIDDFNNGTYSDTQWDGGNAWVELDATGLGNGNGIYTSSIKDATTQAVWQTLSWRPYRPTYKQLPDNRGTESGYPAGNANMGNNVLLAHLNETSGLIDNSSGVGNNGTYNGALYDQPGKFYSSLGFDGADDLVSFADDPAYDITGDVTMEVWVYPTDFSTFPDMVTKGQYTDAYSMDFDDSGHVRFFINANFLITPAAYPANQWYHIVCTRQGSTRRIYMNGQEVATDTYSTAIGTTSTPLYLGTTGYQMAGRLDEVAVYDAYMPAGEVLNHYRRGINRLKFQVKSCDDAACAGESFIGPDGTGSTFYSELDNDTLGTPSFSLTNVTDDQYIQYQTEFETDTASYSPELVRTAIGYQVDIIEGGFMTEASCLDLSGDLVDLYISEIPKDPELGTDDMTYYAIYKTPSGIVKITACHPEEIDEIQIER